MMMNNNVNMKALLGWQHIVITNKALLVTDTAFVATQKNKLPYD